MRERKSFFKEYKIFWFFIQFRLHRKLKFSNVRSLNGITKISLTCVKKFCELFLNFQIPLLPIILKGSNSLMKAYFLVKEHLKKAKRFIFEVHISINFFCKKGREHFFKYIFRKKILYYIF